MLSMLFVADVKADVPMEMFLVASVAASSE